MSAIERVARAAAVGVVGLGIGAGIAQAGPNTAPVTQWCPGQALPFQEIRWDMSVCHAYFTVPFGQGNVSMVYPDGTAAEQLHLRRHPAAGTHPVRAAAVAAGYPVLQPARRADHHRADLR